jgi:hypothetical protein
MTKLKGRRLSEPFEVAEQLAAESEATWHDRFPAYASVVTTNELGRAEALSDLLGSTAALRSWTGSVFHSGTKASAD